MGQESITGLNQSKKVIRKTGTKTCLKNPYTRKQRTAGLGIVDPVSQKMVNEKSVQFNFRFLKEPVTDCAPLDCELCSVDLGRILRI